MFLSEKKSTAVTRLPTAQQQESQVGRSGGVGAERGVLGLITRTEERGDTEEL